MQETTSHQNNSPRPRFTARTIALTAMFLAICLVFQLLKGISVYITGPAVNCVLILASLVCGLSSGIIIAVIAPLAAFLIGATPIINVIPAMLPVIMAGNVLIAVFAALFKNRTAGTHSLLPLGLVIGSAAKACWLWLTVWFVVLPIFGANAPDPMKAAARVTFSVTQLITALIGSAVALIIWNRLRSYIENKRAS